MAEMDILNAYRTAEQGVLQRPMQDLQQVGALQQILAQVQNQQRQQELHPLLLKEHAAKVRQADQNAALMDSMAGSSSLNALSADQLEQLAARAAIGNHPGAVGFAKLAEAKRAKETAGQTLGLMRDTPQALPAGAVVNGQQTTQAIPADEVAAFNAVASGQAKSATPQAGDPQLIGGGAFAPLMASEVPAIAARAKQLQAMVNNPGFKGDPARIQKQIDNLTAMDARFSEAKAAAAQRQTNTIEIKNMFPPAAAAARGSAPPTTGDFQAKGEEFLASIPESDRNLVKKIANYDVDPKTLETRGGQRSRMLSMVTQYDPTYDDTQYANKRRAITQFGTGPQGNTVRSLNVAIEHIDTLKRAADALQNGDMTLLNKVSNEIGKFAGQTPANTFEGIRDIVANEVVKGTIGATGALADRAEAANKVKASNSPQQLAELMNGWTELMGGQVKGLARQYEGASGLKDFDKRFLTQRARDAIGAAEAKAGGGAMQEFANEEEAAKAGITPGTKVKIGGRTGTWR